MYYKSEIERNHNLGKERKGTLRITFVPSYYTRYPNFQKMIGLLSLCNVLVLKNLSLFISKLRKYL